MKLMEMTFFIKTPYQDYLGKWSKTKVESSFYFEGGRGGVKQNLQGELSTLGVRGGGRAKSLRRTFLLWQKWGGGGSRKK